MAAALHRSVQRGESSHQVQLLVPHTRDEQPELTKGPRTRGVHNKTAWGFIFNTLNAKLGLNHHVY